VYRFCDDYPHQLSLSRPEKSSVVQSHTAFVFYLFTAELIELIRAARVEGVVVPEGRLVSGLRPKPGTAKQRRAGMMSWLLRWQSSRCWYDNAP